MGSSLLRHLVAELSAVLALSAAVMSCADVIGFPALPLLGDAGADVTAPHDAARDAHTDTDTGTPRDAGHDGGHDAGRDQGVDQQSPPPHDTGADRGVDAPTCNSDNLLLNASFDAGVTDWQGYLANIATVAMTSAPGGGPVMLVTSSDAAGGAFGLVIPYEMATNVPAGVTFQASAYVASAVDASVGQTVQVVIRERAPNGDIVNDDITYGTFAPGFQLVAIGDAAVMNAGDSVDFYVDQIGGAPSSAFYVAEPVAIQVCSH
jgi:hypothetical protein